MGPGLAPYRRHQAPLCSAGLALPATRKGARAHPPWHRSCFTAGSQRAEFGDEKQLHAYPLGSRQEGRSVTEPPGLAVLRLPPGAPAQQSLILPYWALGEACSPETRDDRGWQGLATAPILLLRVTNWQSSAPLPFSPRREGPNSQCSWVRPICGSSRARVLRPQPSRVRPVLRALRVPAPASRPRGWRPAPPWPAKGFHFLRDESRQIQNPSSPHPSLGLAATCGNLGRGKDCPPAPQMRALGA